MLIPKTKDKIVDVARQLFAKNGVDNTTMNDIAKVSGKARRTIYTYFKSKEDVYWAVVESELTMLQETMKRVVMKDMRPDEKILQMIYTRLDTIKEIVLRNGSLRADFFRNIMKVERVRRRFDTVEIQLIRQVLAEGQEKEVFHLNDLDMTAQLLHYCVKGMEVPYIRRHIGGNLDSETRARYVANIVFRALGKRF